MHGTSINENRMSKFAADLKLSCPQTDRETHGQNQFIYPHSTEFYVK